MKGDLFLQSQFTADSFVLVRNRAPARFRLVGSHRRESGRSACRIVGEGSERTVLAFAQVERDRLVYKLGRSAKTFQRQPKPSVEHMAHGSRYDLS
jgi:hypothetical protein